MLVRADSRSLPLALVEGQVDLHHEITQRACIRRQSLPVVDGPEDGRKLYFRLCLAHSRNLAHRPLSAMTIFPPLGDSRSTRLAQTAFLIPFTHEGLLSCVQRSQLLAIGVS